MNRAVNLFLIAVAIETSVVASGVLAWAISAGLASDDVVRRPLMLAFLFVFPVTTWGALVWAGRQLVSMRPQLAPDHKRHLQGQLCLYFVVLAGMQAWLANLYVGASPPPLDRETFARLTFVFMGVSMAVRGNFAAKISPPTGEGAPDPGAWTRSVLRTGWVMTLLGTVLVVSGIALPVRMMLLVVPFVGVGLILAGRAHRQATRVQAAAR